MKSILFIDPPAFCATVERLVAPALRSRPLAVAPPGADRATILALSPEAESAGITRGMLVRRAQRLCPDLVLLPPNPQLYARASRALHEILRTYAPVIEPRGYGHAFLDLTGTERLFGPAVDVAERIRREAVARIRLPLTVGVAINKLVSEAATRVGRQHGGTAGQLDERRWPLLVPSGSEAPFLAPHPMAVLPEVPDDIRVRLDEYQLERIGQVADIAESELCAVFGARGRLLRAQSLGRDARPVLPPEVKAEYRLSHTLATDTNDLDVLHALLRRLTTTLGRRLRRRGLAARRLVLRVEYADYTGAEPSVPLAAAPFDHELWEAARQALAVAMSRRIAVRTLTVIAGRLVEANAQLDLWDAVREPVDARAAALQRALDRVGAVSAAGSPRQHQLPDRVVALHRAVRGGNVGHRIDRMNDGAERGLAVGRMAQAEHRRIGTEVRAEQRQHPLAELGNQSAALLQSAAPHRGADNLQSLAKNPIEINLGRQRPLEESQQHQPAAGRQQRQVVLEGGAPQHVEDQVHRHRHLVAEPAGAAVDADVESESAERLQLGRRTRGAEDGGTDHLGKLNGGCADTAGHCVDEHTLPPLQPPPGGQRVVPGEKRFGNRRRIGQRQMGRRRQHLVLVNHHVLGVGAAPDQAHHPIAGAPSGHP
jgi:DNA polymerase-4